MNEPPGYQAIPLLLQQRGLTTVYAMIAETNGPWLAYGVQQGLIRMVRTRHEETAVMAANAHSRTTGGLGVASVTRGPGFANSINALRAAADTHVPLLLFTAISPRPGAQTQDLAQEEIARLVGADYRAVRVPEELPATLDAAIAGAEVSGGPQVVAIDDAVMDAPVPVTPPSPYSVQTPVPDEEEIDQIVIGIATAKQPLIISGHGAVRGRAGAELKELAALTGAGLATTLMSLGLFSGHPNEVGIVGGWAPFAAREYYQSVDYVVAFGATLNRFTMDQGRLFPDAHVVQVLLNPADAQSFMTPHRLVVGEAKATASAVVSQWRSRGLPPKPYLGPGLTEVRDSLLAAPTGETEGLDVRRIAARLNQLLPTDRIIVTDSGRAVVPLPDLLDAMDARSWVHGRGYGSIGQGLGLAIGAAIANPNRCVALFVGDGAFLAACHDLDAVRLAGIQNLVIVVLNDERYGMEVSRINHYGLPMDIISQSTPDLLALATVYGLRGVRVSTYTDLELLQLNSPGGSLLVDVRIDPDLDPKKAVGDGSGK